MLCVATRFGRSSMSRAREAARSTSHLLIFGAPSKIAAMGNSFGQLFRITTWGESHGGGVGVVIDGCPPRIELSEEDIQRELDRRRPGQSAIVTPRDEADRCQILSGVFEGRTLGTPISILVMNKDARPEAYCGDEIDLPAFTCRFHLRSKVRHSELAGRGTRFGPRNDRTGCGRRGRKKSLERISPAPFEIVAYVTQIHEVSARIDRASVTDMQTSSATLLRCPDGAAAELMIGLDPIRARRRRFRRRRDRVRRPGTCPRALASRFSTNWKPTWPRRC